MSHPYLIRFTVAQIMQGMTPLGMRYKPLRSNVFGRICKSCIRNSSRGPIIPLATV
jgi:hypothetical protein